MTAEFSLLSILLSEKVNYISRGLLYRLPTDLLFQTSPTVSPANFLIHGNSDYPQRVRSRVVCEHVCFPPLTFSIVF